MAQRVDIRWHRIDGSDAGESGQHVLELGYSPTQLIELTAHVFIHADNGRSGPSREPRLWGSALRDLGVVDGVRFAVLDRGRVSSELAGRGGDDLEALDCGRGRQLETVNDQPRPDLDGLVDIDLEASACTNTFPVH